LDLRENSISLDASGALGKDTLDWSGPVNLSLKCTHGKFGITALCLNEETMARNKAMSLANTLNPPNAVRGCSVTWVPGETIGAGSLGTVMSALDQRTGQVIAVKEVRIDKSSESDADLKVALQAEIDILRHLKHPHIVSYLGHDDLDGYLYIYLEHMPGGSLTKVLAQFGPLDESLIAVYTRQLLEGLDYLHGQQTPVVHRDIKGANVLVGLDCKVKLSDFGCSKRSPEDLLHSMKGSIAWMAPEVIAQTGYGRAADIWSFGCLLIEMATGRRPWGRFDNLIAACARIAMSEETPPVPETLSGVAQDFVESCLRREPIVRPSTGELLQHELVRDLGEDAVERRGVQDYLDTAPDYKTIKELLPDFLN